MVWWKKVSSHVSRRSRTPTTPKPSSSMKPHTEVPIFAKSEWSPEVPRAHVLARPEPTPQEMRVQDSRRKQARIRDSVSMPFEAIKERERLITRIWRTVDLLMTAPERVMEVAEAVYLSSKWKTYVIGAHPLQVICRHPCFFQLLPCPTGSGESWFGFTPLMEKLLAKQAAIMDETESVRIETVRKLLMMSARKKIPLDKIYHARHAFGFPSDVRERLKRYPQYFKIVRENKEKYLELTDWDPSLAVSAFEKSLAQVDKTKKLIIAPHMPIGRRRINRLDERLLKALNSIPAISPYSEMSHSELDFHEKKKCDSYKIHEFLSLTVEKRARMHLFFLFNKELGFKGNLHRLLIEQPQCYFVVGTYEKWYAFLKHCYKGEELIDQQDPLVKFRKTFSTYAFLKCV